MKPPTSQALKQVGIKSGRRKSISLKPDTLVQVKPLSTEAAIPVVLEPTVEGLELGQWTSDNHRYISDLLYQHRALLFRNFQVENVETFERFTQFISHGELLSYLDRTSPRTNVSEKVYVSTVYPPEGHIFLHNESSYSAQWPLKILFCCLQPAERGGETPIADVRNVYANIDPAIRQRFEQQQWMLKRTYNYGFGLSWQEVFQTQDKSEVEAYCLKNMIDFEWRDEQHLETRQTRPAIHLHPVSRELLWFNHIAFFHDTSLEPSLRQELLTEYGLVNLPYNTYYGDGSEIEPEVIEHIRQAYAKEKVVFSWQAGDILLLDNMSVAHGRSPYLGQRQVVVAMTESYGLKH